MKKKLLLKRGLILAFLLVTFFSFKIESYAANFKYSDFDWDELLAQNKEYWINGCEEDEDCVDRVLKTKEKFYKRLYKLLDKYEKKGYGINDNYIIETVFFGLTPDTFADENSREPEYKDQVFDHSYNVDNDEMESSNYKYIASDDNDREGAKAYFKKETDSLKTLINNMIGYTQVCYGVSDSLPHSVTHDDGTTTTECDDGLEYKDNRCVKKVSTLTGNFFDSIGLSFFGKKAKNEKKCSEKVTEAGYSEFDLGKASAEKKIDEDIYWDFLAENIYFDTKFQLQNYFSVVLGETGHKKMSELNEDEYEKYNDDIVSARKIIIDNIKNVLETYGETSLVIPTTTFSVTKNSYWWPIGSDDVTDSNNKSMAGGDPASITITSNYGKRTSPKVGMHYGVDISGNVGSTNVIAAKDGIIVYSSLTSNDNCPDSSDVNSNCGAGYGNHIIIQHTDGNYTLYGHLAQNSIKFNNGDSVVQGQIIGKVGSSGSSTGGHLHFEVRQGGNETTNTIDPLNYISTENTRAKGTSSNLIEFIHSWEGTPQESGSDYVAFDDGYGNITIGWGVVPRYNKERFLSLGVDPNAIYSGTTVSKNVVDTVEEQELQAANDSVLAMLSSNGITLEDYQIDALISRTYNYNVSGFADAYKKYGNTQALYDNYMSKPITSNGSVSAGLVRRREAEWAIFNQGNYQLNN